MSPHARALWAWDKIQLFIGRIGQQRSKFRRLRVGHTGFETMFWTNSTKSVSQAKAHEWFYISRSFLLPLPLVYSWCCFGGIACNLLKFFVCTLHCINVWHGNVSQNLCCTGYPMIHFIIVTVSKENEFEILNYLIMHALHDRKISCCTICHYR